MGFRATGIREREFRSLDILVLYFNYPVKRKLTWMLLRFETLLMNSRNCRQAITKQLRNSQDHTK